MTGLDMGTKRPHHDDPMPSESASGRTPTHPSKRRKSNDFMPPPTKSPSINHLKSKIRDLTRALEHSDHLPPGVRIEKERALAGYKQDVEKIHKDKRKNELIKKYHMVRFFERQKATRALKKLQRRLSATSTDPSSEHGQLEKEVHDAEIDLHYTIYYPLTEKYQSLFPRQEDASGDGKAARKLVAEKPPMWKVVERCAADGTLEALRDGKIATGMSLAKKELTGERSGSKRKGKNGRAGPQSSKSEVLQKQDEEDDDDDGGFFEA